MSRSIHPTFAKLAKQVVALGKKHSRTGFPNPGRVGCPTDKILRAMARRDQALKLEDLPASHVVGCSPCSQEYAKFRRVHLVWQGVKITTALLGAFTLVFLVARFGASPQKALRPSREVAVATPVPQRPVLVPIKVDLSAFSPTRGADDQTAPPKQVRLLPKALRVTLSLPLGLEPGQYAIRMTNTSGGIIADKQSMGHLVDSTTSVEVDLDLSGIAAGHYVLMIRPPGLSWRTYPVVVE